MFRVPAQFPAFFVTFVLATCFVNKVDAACFLERGVTTPGETDAYTCLRSEDFRKDLKLLPLNDSKFVNIAFRDSEVTKIEKEDFQKFGAKALGISMVHCGIEDIDEEAFYGLTELKGLILRRNRIAIVKKGWFKDIAKLESLDLSGNMIREFDSAIFDLIPMIQEFEISENQLTRFDVDLMKAKWPKLKKVGLQWNPYEWAQGITIINYSNMHPGVVKNSYASVDGIRDTYKLVIECQNTTANVDNKELDDCVKAKLAKAVEFPKILEGEKPVEPSKP